MSDNLARNPLCTEIESRFKVAGDWVYGKEDADLVKLLRRAVSEIDILQREVDEFCTSVEDAVKEEREQLLETFKMWDEATTFLNEDAKKLRNAAQGFVTQFDKATAKKS